jgi:iron complex transport system substrate-binding protein
MRRLWLVVASSLLLAACGLAACGAPAATESTPTSDQADISPVVSITSADLPEVSAEPAQQQPGSPVRIVSLASGVGETLAALGVADRVVGRDETSDVPAISAAPVVTKAHSVSAERVLALNPDLVLIDAQTSPIEAIEQIERAGVTVVEVPEAWTLADMVPRTEAVAAAVGVDATSLIAALPTESTSSETSPSGPRVAFLYLRGTSGIYLLGGEGSGADSLITAAGGVDVGAQAQFDPFVPLTAEALATLNPDVLLVMTKGLESVNGVEGLLQLPGVAQTQAGKDGRVIIVDDTVLLSFGPRTPALVERLREALAQVTP